LAIALLGSSVQALPVTGADVSCDSMIEMLLPKD